MKVGQNVKEYFAAVRYKIPIKEYTDHGHSHASVESLLDSLLAGNQAGVDELERAANIFEPYLISTDPSTDDLSKNCNRLIAAMFELQGQHLNDASIPRYIKACLIRSGDIKGPDNST